MVIFQIIFSNMVILDMVIFSDIRKYGNMPYGNVFRNYYHISTSKYGKIKNLWVLLTSFHFIVVYGRVVQLIVSEPVIRLFEILKMFYPPKGVCESRTRRGPLTVFPFYYVFQKGYWASSFLVGNSAFLKFSKCFSLWMGGWVDGWWYFTPFDFPYFQVC